MKLRSGSAVSSRPSTSKQASPSSRKRKLTNKSEAKLTDSTNIAKRSCLQSSSQQVSQGYRPNLLSISGDNFIQILVYVLKHSAETETDSKILFSIALTCKTLFSHVATYIALRIKSHKLRYIDNFFTYDTSSCKLLLSAATVALNILFKSSRNHSVDISNENVSLFDQSYKYCTVHNFTVRHKAICDRDHKTGCSLDTPFWSAKSHTSHCRSFLAWLAIGACSSSFSELHWYGDDILFRGRPCRPYCVIRFCSMFKLPLRRITLIDSHPNVLRNAANEYRSFLQDCPKALIELQISIRNKPLVDALTKCKLPYLEKLSCHGGSVTMRLTPYLSYGKTVIKILKSLSKEAKSLSSLQLNGICFAIEQQGKRLGLSTIAPNLTNLTINDYLHRDHMFKLENLFSEYGNVETLTIRECGLDLSCLEKAYRSEVLPNLKELKLFRVRGEVFEDWEMEGLDDPRIVPLITEYKPYHMIGVNNPFRKKFLSSLPSLHLDIEEQHLKEIASLIIRSRKLKALRLDVGIRNHYRYDEQRKMTLYSKRLIENLLEKASAFKCIALTNCCANLDDGIKILRLMGGRAEEFKMVLTDTPCTVDGLVQQSLNVNSVQRVLDTVSEFCPNITYLRFIQPSFVCEWSREESEKLMNQVNELKFQLKSFNPKTFGNLHKLKYKSELEQEEQGFL